LIGRGIPEALLRNRNRTGNRYRGKEDGNEINSESDSDRNSDSDDNDVEASVDDGFKVDILTPRNYSCIGITTNACTFDMHGLVQLATRK
jgi:hypothetical protein